MQELLNEKTKEMIRNNDLEGTIKQLDIAPDFVGYIKNFIGDLYNRSGFDIKMKRVLTITILATQGNATQQLAYHIHHALNEGITKQEIIDIMVHLSGYAGFPNAVNGILLAKEVFAYREMHNTNNITE